MHKFNWLTNLCQYRNIKTNYILFGVRCVRDRSHLEEEEEGVDSETLMVYQLMLLIKNLARMTIGQ